METLLELLTQYTEENLVVHFLGKYTPQVGAARARADLAAKALDNLAPEAKEYVEKLKLELDDVYSCREQAFLLSGISIGLELGRL